MPNDNLSEALREAYASAPDGIVILHTLDINHVNFSQPIRVVNGHSDITATLENGEEVDFLRYAFKVTLPQVVKNNAPEAKLEIDNVSREITDSLDAAVTSLNPITVTYRQYLNTDLTKIHLIKPVIYNLDRIRVDVYKVSGMLSYYNWSELSFPRLKYNRQQFEMLGL